MLQIFGLLMVVATIIAMFKRVESRLVLIVSGFIMAAASLNVMAAFEGFFQGHAARQHDPLHLFRHGLRLCHAVHGV